MVGVSDLRADPVQFRDREGEGEVKCRWQNMGNAMFLGVLEAGSRGVTDKRCAGRWIVGSDEHTIQQQAEQQLPCNAQLR